MREGESVVQKEILETSAYDFLRTNPYLGRYVCLLGVSGSYGYGTNNDESDIDLRGVTLNRKQELIGMSSFEQFVDTETDTTIYGFMKMINLLISCNPNTIELLGLRPENYLFLSPIGQALIDHRRLFLSQRAIQSFGGYASSQLRRLQNALARDSYPQSEREQHILESVRNTSYGFNERYQHFESGSLKIYIDASDREDMESEIFLDAALQHYPLRDYKSMWAEMQNVVRDYDKIGRRNHKKDDQHLNKHAMHLIRLFMMAIDILEKGEIITYREEERSLLLAIRNGEFQKADHTFKDDFYKMVDSYQKRMDVAVSRTKLPEKPEMDKIEDFVMAVNEKVIMGEI